MENPIKEMVIERVRNGAPYSEVAKEFNKSRCIIKKWCEDAGVKTQWCQMSRKEKDAIEKNIRKNNVVQRVRCGTSYEEAADEFGVSKYIITLWCKEKGVESPHAALKKRAKDIAIECVRRGDSYTQVADKFNVSFNTIVSWCKENGVRSLHAPKNERASEAKKDIAVECVRRGASYKEVASEFGVSTSTIQSWCEKKGVKSQYSHE